MNFAKIGDVCTVVSGSTPKSNVPDYWDGDIVWITPAELTEDSYIIDDSVRHITQKAVQETSLKPFPVGTVILSSRAPIGKTAIAGREMYCNQGFKNLICSSQIYNKYLYFFLSCKTEYLNSLGRGATFKEISKGIVEKIEIPLPDMVAQKQIADEFEQLRGLEWAYHKQISTFDRLVKSRFVEMFGEPVNNSKGYPIHQLSDHILFLTSGSRGWAQYYTDKGEWFITIKNVKDCRISVDDVQCINPPKNAEAERTRLREGDLLISITADLGRTGVVTKEIAEHGAYNNQHLTCIRLDRLVLDPLYVAFFMESEAGKRQFEAKNMSAVKAGLNFDSIRSLKLIVPPLALQKEFSAFVAEVDKSKLAVKQSLEKLETLKKSLMQQYFG